MIGLSVDMKIAWILTFAFLVSVIGRVEVLEATVNSLEAQLDEQCSDTDNAISQWQESYGALEDRNAELEKQVETNMKNDELVRGAETHAETATEPQKISDLADLQEEISKYVSRIKELESKLVGTDAEQLEQRIPALEVELTSMTEQREKLASSLKVRTSELNDQRTSYTEILSKMEVMQAQLGDGIANAAAPQGSVVTDMASMKSQLDEEREASTSTQSQFLAMRKELEDLTVESEEIVDLWKGAYSLFSRLL
jgi:chromosome segregation ATPase